MRPHAYLNPMPVRGRVARPQPKGLPLINMGFNELPFPPSPMVAAALAEAAGHAQSYGSPHNDALRTALGAVNALNPDHLICGNGSEELLDIIARVFARPGDEILISQFGYIQFALTANRVGATLVHAPEKDWTTDVTALLAHVTNHTRVLYLANPNNPTGTFIPVSDLERLAEDLPDHVLLVLDLAYAEFADPAYPAAAHRLVHQYDHVVVTRTFSKAFGLAGARVGWCHGPDWVIPLLYAARGMGTVNALAQAAACAALNDHAEVADRVARMVTERARMTELLQTRDFAVLPSRANFVLISPPDRSPETTEALVEHLFDDAGLIVTRTREPGLAEFLRISVSLPEHTDLLVTSIDRFTAH